MIEVDTNVKRPVTFAQPRIPGEFFKSGCSVAPSPWPKLRPAKSAFAAVGYVVGDAEPAVLFLRRLRRDREAIAARNSARAMGIPSAVKG